MKNILAAAALLVACTFPAAAQEYFDIDVDVQEYPEMVPVPDSPVYYAPGLQSNYFFYDGLYWDYYGDRWYSSAWYNGPWSFVDPIYVPTYVLWVPVRFYHRPPLSWRGWNVNRSPRWGERWGRDWQVRHNEVFRGAQRPQYARAPLPEYQRSYNHSNYPRAIPQQSQLHSQGYAYRPQENVVRQHYEQRGITAGQAQVPQRAEVPQQRGNPAARGDGGRDRDRR